MQKGISTILTVCLTTVVALALGFGGYYYLNKQNQDETASLQRQIDDLNTELVAAKKASTTNSVTSSINSSTSRDATTGWKIYRNSIYKFSFEYPSEYEENMLSSYDTNDGVFISNPADPDNHIISVEAESSAMTLSAYLAQAVANGAFNEAAKITFAGETAYEGIDEGMSASYGILVKRGSYVYHLVLNSADHDDLAGSKAALSTIQNQILSTFQFTS